MPRSLSVCFKFAFLAAMPSLMGCGIVSSLESHKFAVAVLLSTPAMTAPAPSNQMVPALTTMSVFVADVDPSKVTSTSAAADALSADDGAQITLTFTDNMTNQPVSISVPDTGAKKGAYAVTSAMSSSLKVEPVQYTLTIVDSGSTYVLQGLPPVQENISEFMSMSVLTGVNVSNGFTITRTPAMAGYPIAFAAMEAMTAANEGKPPNPAPGSGTSVNWTNAPTDATGLLNLLLSPSNFETATFQIPASAFSDPSMTPYAISMLPVSEGTNPTETGNSSLFLGSNILIGSAAAGIVVSQ